MSSDQPNVQHGYCHCGCGGKTNIADRNFYRLDVLRGEPFRFISGHNGYSRKPLYVEEDRGFDTPCWIWQRRIEANGYGYKRSGGANVGAHRWMYRREVGDIPAGAHLHHICKQRSCVNPGHLRPMAPVAHIRLERAVLTAEDVQEIRAALADFDGYGACTELAERFNVAPKTINDVKLRKTWT